MSRRIVIIGGGPGGYQAAVRASQLGARVTLVEKEQLGGTCLHRGCIPSKALKASAQALETARALESYGIHNPGTPRPDWPAILARKDRIIEVQTMGLNRLMQAHRVQVLRGRGRLLSPRKVLVELDQGGRQELEAERIILATGSRPAGLPGLEPDGKRIITSDDLFRLEAIPPRLAVVGGGVMGCEFAAIMSALGSRVTLVEALERLLPLPSLDPECSRLLAREMKKRRVRCLTGMSVEGWEEAAGGITLHLGPSPLLEHPPGRAPKPRSLEVDQVLLSLGRVLNTGGLGLQELGVELDEKGAVKVGPGLATSLPQVLAVGDMLGPSRPMLAHLAGAEGVTAAACAMGLAETISYQVVPAVAFTSPEVAWVGLSLEQARRLGADAASHSFQFRTLGKSQALGQIAGQCSLVSLAPQGRILGAHIIGPQAGELIHECALALKLGATVAEVAHTIHAHPTLSEVIQQTAESALGLCLHAPPAGAFSG